jgi:hypothetical protein
MAKHNSISKSQSKAKVLAFPVNPCPRCNKGLLVYYIMDSEIRKCAKCGHVQYPRSVYEAYFMVLTFLGREIPKMYLLENQTSEKVSVVGIQSFTAKRKATK